MTEPIPPLLAEVLVGLRACEGQWRAMAAEADVSYSWLTKVATGVPFDPGIYRVQRLHDVLVRHKHITL